MNIKPLSLAIFQSLDISRDQAIFDEFLTIENLINNHPELSSLLDDESVNINLKSQVLIKLFQDINAGEFITKILKFLVSKKSPELLTSLGTELKNIIKKYKNITDLRIYSADKLTQEEINSITSNIDFIENKDNLEINNIIDESLVAGIRIETDEYVLDKSCKLYLEDLQKALK